jgi:hypothetical protein
MTIKGVQFQAMEDDCLSIRWYLVGPVACQRREFVDFCFGAHNLKLELERLNRYASLTFALAMSLRCVSPLHTRHHGTSIWPKCHLAMRHYAASVSNYFQGLDAEA